MTILQRKNKELIEELNMPSHGKQDDLSSSNYSQSFFTQLRACLWKQNKCYWRNVPYNSTRFLASTLIAVMLGILFHNLGSQRFAFFSLRESTVDWRTLLRGLSWCRQSKEDILSGVGAMFSTIFSMGPYCVSSVQPAVVFERSVYYRERASGMYSALPYAIAQGLIEIPYTFLQALIYGTIIYSLIGYEWTATKLFLNTLFVFFYFIIYINFGMMIISASPTHEMAGLACGISYTLWSLFSGFIIPPQRIFAGLRWFVWLCPPYWILYGLTTAQYGDTNTRMATGEGVEDYLRDYFGFRHDLLWEVALVMTCFGLFFFGVYAVAMKAFNFQKR